MGIIKAASGSVGGTLADQWLEVYSCDGFAQDVLAERGSKKVSERSSNVNGEENVISDGSIIIVHNGQCAIAVDKGKVIGCYDTPGENIYHSDRTGSIFHKGGLRSIAKQSFERFGYGGVAAVYQVIMYLDMKEHMGNPFTLSLPVNLKERRTGASIDATIIISGMYSFRITDPITFYQNVCGCSTSKVMKSELLPQFTAEFNTALMSALSKRCREGVSAYELAAYPDDMSKAATDIFNEKNKDLRGVEISSVGIESIRLTQGDKDLLQSIEYAKALTDPNLAAATLVGAQAQAMQDAAKSAMNLNHFTAAFMKNDQEK